MRHLMTTRLGMMSLIAILGTVFAASLAVHSAQGQAAPAAAGHAPANIATFKDVSQEAGIDAILTKTYAHGGAWGDVNGDGYPDLFWGAWTDNGPNRLMINQGNSTFKESVQPSINVMNGRDSGATFADLDNDGDLELLVINNYRAAGPAPNQLLANDGKGNFTDVTAGSGLELPEFSGRNAFVLDYDGDGVLDIIVAHDMWGGKTGSKRTILLRGLGGLKFEDATEKAKLPTKDDDLNGLGGAVGDVNGDGWPDFVHVGSLPRPHTPDIRVYLNNRDGTFRRAANFDFNVTWPLFGNGEDWVCGAALGDLNGDGKIDLIVGHHYGSAVLSGANRKSVSVRAYLNLGNDDTGTPRWRDITDAAGLKALPARMPYVEIQDFNNDGRMDIWNSVTFRSAEDGQEVPLIQYNQGNDDQGVPHFAPPDGWDKPAAAPASAPATTTTGKGSSGRRGGYRGYVVAPTADFDLDGRLDIFRAASDLYRNVSPNLPEYLDVKIDLGPARPNRNGIGATVSIYPPGRAGEEKALLGVQLIEVANGYSSGRCATAHFGAPGRQQVDLVVQLPSGGPRITLPAVKTNQLLTVKQ